MHFPADSKKLFPRSLDNFPATAQRLHSAEGTTLLSRTPCPVLTHRSQPEKRTMSEQVRVRSAAECASSTAPN